MIYLKALCRTMCFILSAALVVAFLAPDTPNGATTLLSVGISITASAGWLPD